MGSYSWTKLLSQREVRGEGGWGVLWGLFSPVRTSISVLYVWVCSPTGATYTDPLYAACPAQHDAFY